MISAAIALAVAAITAGLIVERPAWWQAVVPLAVLGGIAPMIYAVNIRIVPVFSRRPWRYLWLVRAQVIAMLAGAWLVYAGRLAANDPLITAGSLAALASGILFMTNIGTLFGQPPTTPAPPLPYPGQKQVDRIAIAFTRASSIFLLIGLATGVALRFWEPDRGRWELVWAHAMLAGFMLTMASGVSYHVLSRWTGQPWRSLWPIKLHLLGTLIGLPLMLVALAFDIDWLFMIAGPLQAVAIALYLVAIVPLVLKMPGASRPAMLIAALFLFAGIFLGAWFAGHPAMGARLRLTHAGINLFGFAGLLISGVAYYLAPRFAGHPLRWPKLAEVQIALLGGGVLLGSTALGFRAYGEPHNAIILLAHALITTAFLLLGVMIAGAFFGHKSRATTTMVQIKRPSATGQRIVPVTPAPPREQIGRT
jgi:hypothetical protein